jgi:hypothetical protein
MSGSAPIRTVMPMRRLVLVGVSGLVGATGLLGLIGCNAVDRQSFTDSRTEPTAITEVRIQGASGRVTVQHAAGTTKIDRVVHYDEKKPASRVDRVENGVLFLNTQCARRGCDIDYTVKVPGQVKITGRLDSGRIDVTDVASATLSTDSGRITVDGVAGDMTATTDSGRIDASRVAGALSLKSESGSLHASRVRGSLVMRSSSGSVHGDGLTGEQTTVQTDSGSVSLSLASVQDVKIETDSGRVEVTVPSGASWKVRHHTDSGKVEVDIPLSASATHLIDVSTDSGGIEIKEGSNTATSPEPSAAPSASTAASAPAASPSVS